MVVRSQAQVLVTGGTEGIGRGLVHRYLASGATVLTIGRDEARLATLRESCPGLLTFKSDIGVAGDREALARHVKGVMPGINIVINNAGIQRRVALAEDSAPWPARQAEIDVLLAGPIHLNTLLLPMMLRSGARGQIVNVTSGGAFVPQPFAPIYAACKAALHSYTVTLRHALRETPIRVVELIPPAVATGLGGLGASHGVPLDDFCDAVFPQITGGEVTEIGYGMTATSALQDAMEPFRAMFAASAPRFPIQDYVVG